MRSPILFLLFLTYLHTYAQPELNADLSTLPAWMQQLVSDKATQKCTLPKRTPLHTNAFVGNWSVQGNGGNRFNFWSDKQRVVICEFTPKGKQVRAYYMDLEANIRLNANISEEAIYYYVEDIQIPQAGYFREIWSDTAIATGRTEKILDVECRELRGVDGNNDTTYYWSTTLQPDLFADMNVWAQWLCREGELEYLTALCDDHAGACLRANWPKRRFGPEAGSIAVLSITPGATPMPKLEHTRTRVIERRFQWMNNTGIGRLPKWMRAYLTILPQDSLPFLFTPPPQERSIPSNAFIGTFTAETGTLYIGEKKDTTLRLTKYTYWADARRAVMQMDDPHDEGYIIYAVDLDADVAMAAVNEGHSYVIPKLHIGDLQDVGLHEFGNGLELPLTATGKFQTMLGRKCELHTTHERYLSHFWIPQEKLANPIFDIKNWMTWRISQDMKDMMFFGLADKPMPMDVMGTHLTSYKPGKAKPPVLDLSYYQVRDQRIRERRRREEPEEEAVRIEEISIEGGDYVVTQEPGYDLAVPDMVVEGTPDIAEAPPAQEGRWEDVKLKSEPMVVEVAIDPEPPAPDAPSGPPVPLSPYLQSVLNYPVNRFIGSASMEFKRTYDGKTTNWTVVYASTAERSVLISRSDEALPSVRTAAIVTDRKTGDESSYALGEDSTVFRFDRRSRNTFDSPATQVLQDSTNGSSRVFLDRKCEHRVHQSAQFRRDAWVDPKTPSIFMDLFSARKGWDGMDHILHSYHMGIAVEGMPLSEDLFIGQHDQISMRVTELNPGPVDPEVFKITKRSWDF